MASMVDSCILLDIFSEDPPWFEWSSAVVAEQADQGPLVINSVIYAEVSINVVSIEELERHLPPEVFQFRPIPREAAFMAGKCFLQYRRRGGAKATVLPDFLIGAHAAVENLTLITRDPRRFRQYYPTVHLICP